MVIGVLKPGRKGYNCSGTLGGAGIASRGCMMTEAKGKLQEAVLAAVFGPGVATGGKEPGRGGMRSTNISVLN